MLEEGIATREDIYVSMRTGVNHPMGPLEVMDFIGLAPPLLLRRMVTAGWLGRKSGKGFYDYTK